jgi:hypothetical protein
LRSRFYAIFSESGDRESIENTLKKDYALTRLELEQSFNEMSYLLAKEDTSSMSDMMRLSVGEFFAAYEQLKNEIQRKSKKSKK